MQATSTQPQPARKASPRRGSRSRNWLLATALAIGTLVLLLGGPFAVDQYLHAKHDAYETPNSQGYRGAVLPSKAPGELRVAIVGESAAYGYGLITEYSLGPQLERKLQRSEEHTSELQSRVDLVCRLLLEKKKQIIPPMTLTS